MEGNTSTDNMLNALNQKRIAIREKIKSQTVYSSQYIIFTGTNDCFKQGNR